MEMMTPEQRKDFEKFLASNEVSEVLKPWQPWWFNASSSSLTSLSPPSQVTQATIEVIDDKNDKEKVKNDSEQESIEEDEEVEEEQEHEDPPVVYSTDEDTTSLLKYIRRRKEKTPRAAELPPLTSLTRQQPSPQLLHNVCNVLYAYAYTMRLYDGVWFESDTAVSSAIKSKGKQRTNRSIECYMVINEISKGMSSESFCS